ncbi:hypothetical protein DRQ50_07515 [bacterium]|nr:MAG: hypothetical protein DRQ50_07515 [bacterium]
MSLARKQALISGSVWLVITVIFAVNFFSIGAEDFASPAGTRARGLAGAIILPGYIINFFILWWSRRGRRAGDLDERDKAIELRASEQTMIVILMVVFLFGIGLYETHLESGTVPVGWLYLLSYGMVALVSLVHPVLSLINDFAGHADG